MEARAYNRPSGPPFVCAGCGDELVLTSSGHQFCANRWCKDGFDVRPDWRLVTMLDLIEERKVQ